MKEIISHPAHGEIIYTESFWTGKKTLKINGVDAKPLSKKEFLINGEKFLIKGSVYTGISIHVNNEPIEVSPKPKWYEVVLSLIPVLFLLTWGNSPDLCAIFPVIGGAIGGAIGALFSLTSLHLMKKAKSPIFKILVGIGIFALTLLVSFVLAILLIMTLA